MDIRKGEEMKKIQKVFICNYCLPVDIRKDILPCKFVVFGNMPGPVFCPFNAEKCKFEFLSYQE
jgi:hypothetical protein